MDNKALAEKIRRRIFEQASEDGRVMHGDSMDRVIAEVLDRERPQQSWPYAGGTLLCDPAPATPHEWR